MCVVGVAKYSVLLGIGVVKYVVCLCKCVMDVVPLV